MTSQTPDTLVNGEAHNSVAVSDRGIAYGDGVFETMLCVKGDIPLLPRHLTRLNFACKALGLTSPGDETWKRDVHCVVDPDSIPDRCVIKLILTRGSGGIGYAPLGACKSTRIVQRLDYPEGEEGEGLNCDMLSTQLGSNRTLAGIKHLNRLDQVLAAREMRERNLQEGLVCNHYGFLIEAVSSNVILVFGDRVVTPKLDTAGVRGVMRDLLIDQMADSEWPIVKDFVHGDVVQKADEIILCNSVRGVRRVREFGGRRLTQRTVFDKLDLIGSRAFNGDV